jgi:hypothetical protein
MKGASVCLQNRLCGAGRAATVIALALATTLPAAAQNEEKPRWFGGTYDRTAILAYGVPDSDYVILNFSCHPGAPAVKVGVQDEDSGAKEGQLVRVRLATAGAQVEFSDKAVTNQESGGIELHAELPPDEALRRILTSDEPLEVTVEGHTQRYAKDKGSEAAAAKLFATCEAPKPANDLDVTVTNKASLPLQSFAYSQAGANAFESGEFGNRSLAPGASRTFIIPDGRKICTFDIAVIVARDDAECCEEPKPAGTQDLCKNGAFVVHD